MILVLAIGFVMRQHPMGAYCEIRDFPADKLIKIPNEISDEEAASIFLQGMTVEYLFTRLYEIKKDQYILFHAAAGWCGLSCLSVGKIYWLCFNWNGWIK